jgi:hypothetical protein
MVGAAMGTWMDCTEPRSASKGNKICRLNLGSLVIGTEFGGINVKGEWSFWHIINGIALRC